MLWSEKTEPEKGTLMKILSGEYQQDSGEVFSRRTARFGIRSAQGSPNGHQVIGPIRSRSS